MVGPGEVEPLEPTLNFLNEFSHEVNFRTKIDVQTKRLKIVLK